VNSLYSSSSSSFLLFLILNISIAMIGDAEEEYMDLARCAVG
jgi:hypothetical protein